MHYNPQAQKRGTLLVVAPPHSYRISPYLKAAEKLGLATLICSQNEHSLVPKIASGMHIDLQDIDRASQQIINNIGTIPVAGIIATDDFTTEIAAKVAQTLKLPHNSPKAMRFARRKDLSRAQLAQFEVPVPQHKVICLEQDILKQLNDFPYPCVAKPVSLSASRGVIRCNNSDQLIEACKTIKHILHGTSDAFEKTHILLEEYIAGEEYAVEGILTAGKLHTLAIFDKPDPLHGPYFEETLYITPSHLNSEQQAHLIATVQDACHALGLRTGPIHAELRLHNNKAWILEVAARTIGGECARLLELGTGQSLEELVISYAIGEPLQPSELQTSVGVLMIPTPKPGVLRRIEGVLEARRVPFIEDIALWVRDGHELTSLPQGSSYLGFMFAQAASPTAVEKALREAHAKLNIVIGPLWKISPALTS